MEQKWKKRRLGRTNLFVTSPCWGCAPLGNMSDDFGYQISLRRKRVPDTQRDLGEIKAFCNNRRRPGRINLLLKRKGER